MAQGRMLSPITKIVEKASLRLGEPTVKVLHKSLPIPCPGPQGLLIAFIYAPAAVTSPDSGFEMYPPTYIAYFDAENTRFVDLRASESPESSGGSSPDAPVGSYLSPADRLRPEFLAKQLRLYEDYDLLMGPFALGTVHVTPEVKQAAVEFKLLFPELAEQPLLPYYQSLGTQFFGWIARLGV